MDSVRMVALACILTQIARAQWDGMGHNVKQVFMYMNTTLLCCIVIPSMVYI